MFGREVTTIDSCDTTPANLDDTLPHPKYGQLGSYFLTSAKNIYNQKRTINIESKTRWTKKNLVFDSVTRSSTKQVIIKNNT